MTITASMVGELRAKTDAPMMECKKALTEANGDMDKAVEILRVKLGNKAGKAAGRVTAEGVVACAIVGQQAAMVEVNCETDFVSKNDSFIAFCQGVADLAVKHADSDIDAMAALPLTVDGFGPTVEDARKGLIGKIGENMTIRRVARSQGHAVTSYLHGTRIGVTVQYEGSEQAARDVAMHVALSSADVPAALVEQERSVAKAKAEESGKPPEIATKMIEGAVAKYLKEVSLLDQPFVKNDKQTVAQMLKAENTTVHAFTLYVVGEGIEKKADDFAAEVAAQVAAARQG
jgi:elongation factor Ts